ncbi:MAG: response regulator transcription factor [Gammaproteobacteria bacterium]
MNCEPATIYVVDDDAAVRSAFDVLLSYAGWKVLTFESAEAVLEFAPGPPPDLILLDLHLLGMNGVELLAALRSRGFVAPAVFITGYGDHPLVQRAHESDAVGVFGKPVRGTELLPLVDDIIRGRYAPVPESGGA